MGSADKPERKPGEDEDADQRGDYLADAVSKTALAEGREVERVARAICEKAGRVPYEHYRREYDDLARAAIAATQVPQLREAFCKADAALKEALSAITMDYMMVMIEEARAALADGVGGEERDAS